MTQTITDQIFFRMTRKRQKGTPAIYTLDDTSSAHPLVLIVLAVVTAIIVETLGTTVRCITVSVTCLDVSCPSMPSSLCVFDYLPHTVSSVSHECLPVAFVSHATCFTACISLRMPHARCVALFASRPMFFLCELYRRGFRSPHWSYLHYFQAIYHQ